MTIIVVLAAVILTTIFDRQRRRHRFDEEWEYRRLGQAMPIPRPEIKMEESILNIVVGLFFTSFVGYLTWGFFGKPSHATLNLDPGSLGVFLGLGTALVVLGIRAVVENLRYRKKRFGDQGD